jgi:bla regulator protein blaR1
MNILLIYMVKVAVYLAAFYLVYSLLLSRDTTYARNRGFLLLSTVFSLLLPLVSFQVFKPLEMKFFGKFLSEVFVTANGNGDSATGLISAPLQIIETIYLIGVGISLITFIFNLANLGYLIIRQKSYGSRIIRFHSFNTAGFSAMGYIFINTRLCPEEA